LSWKKGGKCARNYLFWGLQENIYRTEYSTAKMKGT
jgi:hypothetical protein